MKKIFPTIQLQIPFYLKKKKTTEGYVPAEESGDTCGYKTGASCLLEARDKTGNASWSRVQRVLTCLLEKTDLYPVAEEELPVGKLGSETTFLYDVLSKAQKMDWSQRGWRWGDRLKAVAINK